MTTVRATSVLLAATLLGAPGASGQNVMLDQGEFRIVQNGQEIGRETFQIRRVGTGADAKVYADAVVELDGPAGRRELRPVAEAGPDLTVALYENNISGDEMARVAISLTGNRFIANVRSDEGEQQREYRATAGSVILDHMVAHQYWFIASRVEGAGGVIPVIVPRSAEQGRLRVASVQNASVTIGGTALEARHMTLEGVGPARELWVDAQGRILRVSIPAEGYMAERREAP